jgi:hypothetical protein
MNAMMLPNSDATSRLNLTSHRLLGCFVVVLLGLCTVNTRAAADALPLQTAAPTMALETNSQIIVTNVQSNPANQDFVAEDRLWLINTRSITSNAACANLRQPSLSVFRLTRCGQQQRSSIDEYLATVSSSPASVLYGNRITATDAVKRGLEVYRRTRLFRVRTPIDWIIWSWPSEQQGILGRDVRIKAARTDAQGLYMGWLLRRHAEIGVPTAMIGYSFGGRVVSGALHTAAGGSLVGRRLDGQPVTGMNVNAGLVAPAIESHWMQMGGNHSQSTKNLNRLVLLYNHSDVVLKRYWLINRVRGESALGYTGPTSFARRVDGSRLPVLSKDCSSIVGIQHSELDYYQKSCRAGRKMSALIDDLFQH